jgi:hypothetical protein
MKHNLKLYVMVAGIIIFFSGCGRVVDWATDSLYQGDDVEDYAEVPREHMRSITVYDQLSTHGKFDVMWLSDAVRIAYAQSHAQKYALDKDRQDAFLRRQLEENRHFIVFYVLVNNQMTLVESAANWALSLEVANRVFVPSEIKEVDLTPEYRAFFGKKYNRFKVAYCVKFDAKDTDDNDVLSENVQQMIMHVTSVKKQAALTWKITR